LKIKYLPLLVATAVASMASTSAIASGYRFGSQSVSAQGTADANGAEASDASTQFYNAAGITRLQGQNVTAGLTVVVPHSTYTDTGSTRFTQTPVGGTGTEDFAPSAVAAPSFYYTQQLNSQWTAGLGAFVPYGTKLDYGNTWTGRYALTSIKLQSEALNPSLAFKLDEHHSFGFGVTAEYMKANLAQAVDVPGTIAALSGTATGNALVQQIVALGGNPAVLAAVKDGHGENEAKDWGYGFNLGYMFQLNESTRFGIAYRSSIKHELTGHTVWDFSNVTSDPIVNQVIAASSRKANSAALVELRTPETLSVNGFSQLNSKWAAMADVTWTRSSRLGDLNIQFPGTTEGDEVIRQQWKNTVRVSLGANYSYSDALTLRGGLAWDQSPVRSDELRHAALPDSNRTQFSIGANYKVSSQSSLDLAYSFLHFQQADVDYTNLCSPVSTTCTGNGETTRGTYKTYMQLLGIAYNYRF
jgi:long-chain fatty acid transport protein